LYIYIDNLIHRLDCSNSRHWLKAQCRNFDSNKEKVDVTKMAEKKGKLKAN